MPHWIKQGRLFTVAGQHDWMLSHAQLPVLDVLDADTLRIFFATRDRENRSRIAFVDVSADCPRRVLRVSDRPVLDLGELGCFDDRGVLPSWVTTFGGRKYIFYIGISTGTTVPGRAAIGVAESRDGGESFERVFPGPVVDRHSIEPHFCTAPCVYPGASWRMWYASGTHWDMVDGRPEPAYVIRQTDSPDGLMWGRPGGIAIDFADCSEAGLTRPSVILERNRYRMWFCTRGQFNFRTSGPAAYRIAYAESADGNHWERMPVQPGLEVTKDSWDSDMLAYPYVYKHNDRLEMLYNGNGFGQSGFGYATLAGTNFV
jgi:hypothetical protein